MHEDVKLRFWERHLLRNWVPKSQTSALRRARKAGPRTRDTQIFRPVNAYARINMIAAVAVLGLVRLTESYV